MRCRVVVAGAGFGGIYASRILSRHRFVDLTIVDEYPVHVFYPLIYQVATCILNPEDVVFPIRSLFRNKQNVRVFTGKVQAINRERREVQTSVGNFGYDYLVLSCGSKPALPNQAEWQRNSISLKTIDDAIEIRNRVLTAFEAAENSGDERVRKIYGTFVIIGGGSTGIELAGDLSQLYFKRLRWEFRRISPSDIKVILLESGKRLLPSFPKFISDYVDRSLRRLGVEVRVNSEVKSINAQGVCVADGFIPSKTVIWAAGVKPSEINTALASEFEETADDKGRIVVAPDLSLRHDRNVFLIGDQACVQLKEQGALPGLAAVAMQEGRHVARQIINDLRSRPRKDFVYKDKGQLVVIGGGLAVGQIGRLNIYGRAAWLVWAIVHIVYLKGVKNRISVLLSWFYSLLARNAGSRLVFKI